MLAGAAAFSATDHVSFWVACYWALSTASTVGYGDLVPESGAARVVAAAVMLTAIPLLGAAFASLTAMHLRRHVRDHVDRALAERARGEGKDAP
jgi:voltage-gated potassium channel